MTLEFEDVLLKVGDYGKYQKRLLYCFLIPSAILFPWFSLNNLFMISLPDHWCHVPELNSFNLTIDQQKQLIRPESDPFCTVYNINYTDLLTSSTNWTIPKNTTTESCPNGWDYDKTNYDYTAATQWNWVCDHGHYGSLFLTMTNVGSIIGTPIYGCLSDRIGRRLTFFVLVMFTAVTAISSILVTNMTAFIVLRTLNGTLMPSIFQLPFIIILELVGPNKRTRMNGVGNFSWTVGMCILPLVAWLSRDWIKLGLITSSCIFLLFLHWPILPESPRWLVSRGRYSDATKILTKVSETNGTNIEPADIYIYLEKLGEKIKKEKAFEKEEMNGLWKSPQLRKKFLIITYCWVADIAAYYGLQLNGYNLAGNEFLNFFLLAVAELPGYACSWIFMERVGRRWCSVSGLLLTGIACLVSAFFDAGVPASFVAKFGASVAFMAVYQQSSELYPTSVRGLGMGLSATFAGGATIAVPYMVYLNRYGEYIPFVIIAFLTITAAIGACFLPETLNQILPQTILDAEKFGLTGEFFSCTKQKRSPLRESHNTEMSPALMTGNRPEDDDAEKE